MSAVTGLCKNFCTEDLRQPSLLLCFALERWDRWGGKKKDLTLCSPPHILALGVERPVWKMSVCVSSREPQLKPHCPGSNFWSDKLELILLSKDVILVLTVILALVSLVEACVMWHSVYPEGLWERATHSIISLLSHSKKRVTQVTCAFICFLW